MKTGPLKIGREYEVELYPGNEKVNAFYIGVLDLGDKYGGRNHCFVNPQIGGANEAIMVSDKWIEISQDKITHKQFSSFAIHRVKLNGSDRILEGRLSGLGVNVMGVTA